MICLLGCLTPSSPHGLLPVVVWDLTVHQISTLFPAMSLTPMVLMEKIIFVATRTACLAGGPPWFEGTEQRVSVFLGLRAQTDSV